MYCDEFSALILSDTVKEIKTDAFTSCSSLKKIILGENVTTISNKAFYNCGNISTVAFNENLSSIGRTKVFTLKLANVTSVVSISIPATVTNYAGKEVTAYNKDFTELKVLPGDVNSDGVVDTLDRMVLNRYLANWEGYESLPCAG